MSMSSEALGREVRRVWVEWAQRQPNPKPSWLIPWEELSDEQKQVDILIGEKLYNIGANATTRAYSRESCT